MRFFNHKKILTFLLFSFSLSYSSFVSAKHFSIFVRDQDFKLQEKLVDFSFLNQECQCFETDDFKIVQGRHKEAIKIQDPLMAKRAAQVLYHLNNALTYARIHFPHLSDNIPLPLVIRLDMQAQFTPLGHFKHPVNDDQFNNSKTVPGGSDLFQKETWGPEIWFRPPREVTFKQGTSKEVSMATQSLKTRGRDFVARKLLVQWRQEDYVLANTKSAFTEFAVSFLFLESLDYTFPFIINLFSPKKLYLDSAMIPEIVTHEFAHVLLAPYIGLHASTPIIEGFADYFAALVARSPLLAKKAKPFIEGLQGKDGENQHFYDLTLETATRANEDFVFSLLWQIEHDVFPERDFGKQLIWHALTKLNGSSTIREGLTKAFKEALLELETNSYEKTKKVMKLAQFFHQRGL
jgi:predicted metallopeptidase